MEMRKLEGIYLVIDPKRNWENLLLQLESALKGGLNIVQVWNHWEEGITEIQKTDFLKKIKKLTAGFHAPVFMHDDWKLALKVDFDGVHFDDIPDDYNAIGKRLAQKIIGITVGNHPDKLKWAEEHKIDYISFCAVFPSSSVDTCEIVDQKNIKAARSLINVPIFLSGGISTENIQRLKGLNFDGVAIISGILDAPNPADAVRKYKQELQRIKQN